LGGFWDLVWPGKRQETPREPPRDRVVKITPKNTFLSRPRGTPRGPPRDPPGDPPGPPRGPPGDPPGRTPRGPPRDPKLGQVSP